MSTSFPRLTALALAAAAAMPAAAQTNQELLNELQALKARMAELEKKLQPAAPATKPQWGMTPEQAQELSRVTVKAEALEDSRDASGLKGFKVNGYMDPTFLYSQARNSSGFQFLNQTLNDGYNFDNSYFGTAVIDFQKEMEGGTRWRLTLSPNRGVGTVFDAISPVHEATVSIPLGDLQTRLIAGQVPDWSGYEYLPATQNKLITHNLLFDFTLPTAYTGVGLDITRGKWITKAMLANVNSSKRNPGEKAPAFVYRVDYSRGEFQGFGFAGAHGKAANFADPAGKDSRIDLFEFDAYFVRGNVTMQGQLSYGKQKGASIAPDPVTGALRDAQWYGASVLAAYKFAPRLEGIVRGDYVSNRKNGGGLLGYTGMFDASTSTHGDYRNGIGMSGNIDCATDATVAECNRGANRMALSLGMSYLYDLNTTFKFEVRHDRADQAVFLYEKDGSYRKSTNLFGASVLVAF
jgi:Protein of unknown function (DUF3138)